MDASKTAMTNGQTGERACRTCTLCCRLPDIDVLAKPANVWCRHCTPGVGCSAYASRPETCRAFTCSWLTDLRLAPEWDPLVSRMMVYQQGPQTTVLVDPDHPPLWQRAPYKAQLEAWARQAEANGGYVIVFVGDEVFKVGTGDGGV